MLIKIYFLDNLLSISDETEGEKGGHSLVLKDLTASQLSTLLLELEKGRDLRVRVQTTDPLALLERIKSSFSFIQAAGGFVYRAPGELLMMYRRGFCDLRKGKRDEEEELETW